MFFFFSGLQIKNQRKSTRYCRTQTQILVVGTEHTHRALGSHLQWAAAYHHLILLGGATASVHQHHHHLATTQ